MQHTGGFSYAAAAAAPPGLPIPNQVFYAQSQPLSFPPSHHNAFPPLGSVALPHPHTRSASSSSRTLYSTPPTSNPTSPHVPPLPVFGDTPTDGLDRFASVYIPQWLRLVNSAKPDHVIVPEKACKQDITAYPQFIYPKALLDDFTREEAAAEKQLSYSGNLEKLSGTGVDTKYASKLLKLQAVEHKQRKEDLASANLYAVPLTLYEIPNIPKTTKTSTSTFCLYKLQVPALREGYPMLDVNDVVRLRQLFPDIHGWRRIEFEATVYAVKRGQATIILRCDALRMHHTTMLFNVQFRPQDRPFFSAHTAIAYLGSQLPQPTLLKRPDAAPKTSLGQSWLFPTAQDYLKPLDPQQQPPPVPVQMPWVDQNLNEEQKLAVQSICFSHRRIPFLINGPPGTGKTKTLVEAVLQILKAYPEAHVLVCGASNPSSDTLAARLSPHLSPKELLRFNDESRPFDELRPTLLPWCHIKDDRFGLPDLSDLLKYRVIVTSVLDASVLYAARITNTHLARLDNRLKLVFQPNRPEPNSYHFEFLLIDEAAQASEPELAPALSVVIPDSATVLLQGDNAHRRLPQLVLCGDQYQLGPYITSETARTYELDLSLLQRIFECPLYTDHPRARHNMPAASGARLLPPPRLQDFDMDSMSDVYSDSGTEEDPSPTRVNGNTLAQEVDMSAPFANLVNNYRSHPGLLMVPSSLFYNDTLEPCAAAGIQTTQLLKWWKLKNQDIPFLMMNTGGSEEMFDEGASWYNDLEVKRVVEVVKSLVYDGREAVTPAHGIVKAAEISIISPFREQVWKIRLALRSLGLGEVNVGRESDMQGAENRIVIISTVRTAKRFVSVDLQRNRGLIQQPKRFNVATTRAKELLVVVGDMPTLYADPYWRAMIRFALRRGCYDGPGLIENEEDPAGGVSRLEEAFVSKSKGGSNQEILAGSVARLALDGQ